MTSWQRKLRFAIALGAVVLAIAVAFAFQRRADLPIDALIRTDPNALVEMIGGRTFRINAQREESVIESQATRTYEDGTVALTTVKITTKRDGGRTFVLTADEARVGKNESEYIADGNVRLTSDGLAAETGRATYAINEGVVRAPGPTKFSRGRMTGSGVGFEFDRNRDVVRILSDAVVQTTAGPADDEGKPQEPMTLNSGSLELDRVGKIVRFAGTLHAVRGSETIDADSGVAYLTEQDDGLQKLELRGNSRITAPPGGAGSLQAMTGRDIDLTYGPDGQTLEHARIVGAAVIRVAGEAQQAPREIEAETIDLPLGPDGSLPTALTARDSVGLTLPGHAAAASRTITADSLDGTGEAGKGLTGAVFSGRVSFHERAADTDRTATSERLEVAMKPGFSEIDAATFIGNVKFVDGGMTASAARGRYALATGVLDLSGTGPAAPRPSVRDAQIAVDAGTIQVVLEGPKLEAKGAVRSVLQPARDSQDRKTPSMFKKDQPVNVTADALSYDGGAEQATYTGNAQLWQAETTVKGARIAIDGRNGDLRAAGEPVATTTVLMQTTTDGRKERSIANAKSKELHYQESDRRAIYTGDAYVNGPQGELRAARIQLYLKPSGDELERAEAFEAVTLTEQRRKTTGDHLVYTSADERYVVTGKPMKIFDECGGVTEGRSLTYLKGADRIVVDGSEQMRTRTQGGAKCP